MGRTVSLYVIMFFFWKCTFKCIKIKIVSAKNASFLESKVDGQNLFRAFFVMELLSKHFHLELMCIRSFLVLNLAINSSILSTSYFLFLYFSELLQNIIQIVPKKVGTQNMGSTIIVVPIGPPQKTQIKTIFYNIFSIIPLGR